MIVRTNVGASSFGTFNQTMSVMTNARTNTSNGLNIASLLSKSVTVPSTLDSDRPLRRVLSSHGAPHPRESSGRGSRERSHVIYHSPPATRIAPQRRHVLPHFIIVGAQKAGTSALFKALVAHPKVVKGVAKEIHFFDIQFHRGRLWYESCFPASAPGGDETIVTGEATPYYLFHPHAPRRCAEVLPDVRLIALLRNPVDRAYSHYHHEVRRGRERLSFDEAIRQERERLADTASKLLADDRAYSYAHQHFSYLSRGLYGEQIAAWRRHVAADRMLIATTDVAGGDGVSENVPLC